MIIFGFFLFMFVAFIIGLLFDFNPRVHNPCDDTNRCSIRKR